MFTSRWIKETSEREKREKIWIRLRSNLDANVIPVPSSMIVIIIDVSGRHS